MDRWNGSDQDQAPAVTVHGDFERWLMVEVIPRWGSILLDGPVFSIRVQNYQPIHVISFQLKVIKKI